MTRGDLGLEAEKIALLLKEKYPDLNPLTIQFPDLARYVGDLDGIPADTEPNTPLLESIQLAWLEEIADR